MIIDTENIHFLLYQKILSNYGYKLTHDSSKSHLSGRSLKGGLTSILPEIPLRKGLSDEELMDTLAQQKINLTVDHFQKQIVYFADTIEFIKKIAHGGRSVGNKGTMVDKPILAMATGLEQQLVDLVLNQHNLRQIFSVVVTAEQYTKSKPDPECYQIALQKMNLKAQDVIGVEDAPAGVQALNKAKIYSIGLTNTHSREELHEAAQIAEALTELIK